MPQNRSHVEQLFAGATLAVVPVLELAMRLVLASRSRGRWPIPELKGSSEYPICEKLVSPNQVKLTTAPVAVMWGD